MSILDNGASATMPRPISTSTFGSTLIGPRGIIVVSSSFFSFSVVTGLAISTTWNIGVTEVDVVVAAGFAETDIGDCSTN